MEADAEILARWNKHDAALLAKMVHKDAEIFPGPLGIKLDRTAHTALNELFFLGFSDGQLESVRRIDLGDGWILSEGNSWGTHDGPYMGMPATGFPGEIRIVFLSL